MFSNNFRDFISDIEVTNHRHYDQWYRKQNRESSFSGIVLKNRHREMLLEVSYFAKNIMF